MKYKLKVGADLNDFVYTYFSFMAAQSNFWYEVWERFKEQTLDHISENFWLTVKFVKKDERCLEWSESHFGYQCQEADLVHIFSSFETSNLIKAWRRDQCDIKNYITNSQTFEIVDD